MRHHLNLLYFCLAIGLHAAVSSDDVLSQMDQSSGKFTGLSANLTRITYTKVLDEKNTETGTILLKKQGPKALQVLIDFTKPDLKTVFFKGGKAEIYYPKLKTVQEYDVGKQRGLVDQFLLIGFGTAGRELKANYSIKYTGEETVAGQRTNKLELTPKSSEFSDKLRKLELWISDSGAYPVQQKFLQPSGDYYLFTYSDVKLNPQVSDQDLKLQLPKGVKRERVQ